MALPVILAFIARMGLKHAGGKAVQMAVKKFGKKAVQQATTKMSYVGKEAAKKIKPKTYLSTKIHKETLKIRKRLSMTGVKRAAKGKKPTIKQVRKFMHDAFKPIRGRKMPERTKRMIENWKFKKK